MSKYFPRDFESKWQDEWAKQGIYQAKNDDTERSKKYILDMFPYPSGDGLHVGHFKGYVASDIISRYYRLKGFNVLHPMGWDAFGLPAENYAIKTGVHPKITTVKNISNIKKQMQIVGLSYDWSREIDTTDPNYYKWTQWIFLKLFEKGLAYEDEVPINWCPKDKTGLANEEVVNGACERCGTKVERKVIRQWILRITKYADRLVEDLEGLDWPQFIKDMQINWIGKSHGLIFNAPVKDTDLTIQTFSAHFEAFRADTFVVIAPDHPFLKTLVAGTENEEEVLDFAKQITDRRLERGFEEEKESEGIFTGRYISDPVGNGDLPIWIASYALADYGTGIVKCSAHDERDFKFAKKYGIELKPILVPMDPELRTKVENLEVCYTDMVDGILLEPSEFAGRKAGDVRQEIVEYVKKHGLAEPKISYKIRDWLFSRQRYWGEPIPLVHCPKDGIVAIPESELPLKLPEVEKYEPTGTGESPLAGITEWVNTTCPKCGGPAKRETNTMPQWAGSCWYYMRFCDPKNDSDLILKDIEKYWLPVDWYIGGAEHAVLHLLYSRFWHKFLFDIGAITTKEPFQKLTSVGLVLAEGGQKMSKSKGNVIPPETIINEYGADTLRVYESFMGPFENTISWDPGSINGVYKFLSRVWEIVMRQEVEISGKLVDKGLNRLTEKVGSDIENMKFNTSVAAMMEFLNLSSKTGLTKEQKKKFLIILAPFAPHITEELWNQIGESFSVHQQKWPEISEQLLEEDEVIIVIQVNGKVRDQIVMPKNVDEKTVLERAKSLEKVNKFLIGEIRKVIFVPGRILNIVV